MGEGPDLSGVEEGMDGVCDMWDRPGKRIPACAHVAGPREKYKVQRQGMEEGGCHIDHMTSFPKAQGCPGRATSPEWLQEHFR